MRGEIPPKRGWNFPPPSLIGSLCKEGGDPFNGGKKKGPPKTTIGENPIGVLKSGPTSPGSRRAHPVANRT